MVSGLESGEVGYNWAVGPELSARFIQEVSLSPALAMGSNHTSTLSLYRTIWSDSSILDLSVFVCF